MSKDPAVLFYTSDFLTGVSLMSDDQVGKYIKLLCIQHQKGGLTKNQIVKFCGGEIDEDIFEKFNLNEDGFYYNERMKSEAERRRNYKQSRIDNLKGGDKKEDITPHMDDHMEPHMETETETINSNESKLNKRCEKFREKVFELSDFNQATLTEFFYYWTEPNKSGTKMRYELEKTWDLNRRLKRWDGNSSKFSGNGQSSSHPDYYNAKYERTLNMTLTSEYHKHLTSLGWKKITAPGGTNWKKP